jgi:hypothetical protein
MVVKLVTLDLYLPACTSLKEKRFVLSSIKTRLHRRYNVAVSEVDFQDKWQRSRIALVTVSTDNRTAESCCDEAIRFVERDHRVEILDCQRETR